MNGKKARQIVSKFGVEGVISDDDLRFMIEWYKDLLGFFDNGTPQVTDPLLLGLITDK